MCPRQLLISHLSIWQSAQLGAKCKHNSRERKRKPLDESPLEKNMNNTKTIRELILCRDRLTSAFPGIYSIYCRVVDGIIAQVQFLHFAVCQIKFSALDFPYAPFALWRYFLKTPNTNIDTHIHTHKHTYTYRHGHAFIFRDFSSSFESFT